MGGKNMFASSKSGSVAAGVGIGMALGAAAGMAGAKMMTGKGRRACRRGVTKCMKTMEGMMNGVSSVMK